MLTRPLASYRNNSLMANVGVTPFPRQAYLLETATNGVTSVVYTQEPTPFGSLISQWSNA